jgi:hypothetical protein
MPLGLVFYLSNKATYLPINTVLNFGEFSVQKLLLQFCKVFNAIFPRKNIILSFILLNKNEFENSIDLISMNETFDC